MSSRICLLRSVLISLLGLGLGSCQPIQAPQVSRTTIAISLTVTGAFGNAASGDFQRAWISDDAKRIAFVSKATNLVPDQQNSFDHVYVKNRTDNTVLLASRDSDNGDVPVDDCSPDMVYLSATGRFVVFVANRRMDNGAFPPGFATGPFNVFVRDLQLRKTYRAIDPSIWPSHGCMYPGISADGRYVVFETESNNLGFGAPSGLGNTQVYLSDLSTNPPTLKLVSHAFGNTGTFGNFQSGRSSISSDGRTICFYSGASNLDPADPDGIFDIFVAAVSGGLVSNAVVVSLNPAGVKANGGCFESQISPNGRFVTFSTLSPNMGVGSNGNIMLRDLTTGMTTCVTVTSDGFGPSNAVSTPRVNSAGRVVFVSRASNLTGNFNNLDQLYLGLAGGAFEEVTVSENGVPTTDHSRAPSISSQGFWIAWSSAADNLVTGDTNGVIDVFARGTFGP